MKVSMKWLKELVRTDISSSELAELFNLHSAEIEEEYKLVDASNIVVGHVVSKEKHPDADKLSVCQVDIGGEVSQIVCGAPNVDKGQNVIVSLPGAVLPGGFKIKKSTIRGVESNGMICSLIELGIDKKFADASGIHVIEEDVKPGDNPLKALELDDEVMVLDLTPNRADLLSMYGVAYDTAAILDSGLTLPVPEVNEVEEVNPVTIRIDTENCPSYYARVIKDIEIKESPRYIQSRLIAAGVRPINNVVDITNYVMLLTGQPLHAFDYDLLDSNVISVRMAEEGETLTTLDETERKLTTEDIVITNDKRAVALGGVMGGFDTEIVDNSKTILLESATFNPVNIRKTSRRLDLRSEASTRFERKVDPNRTIIALEMATMLFEQYASGKTLNGISKVDNAELKELEIVFPISKINGVLGTEYSDDMILDTLEKLHFSYELDGEELTVYAPTRRQDMTTYQDVIEEVGRIIGYDKLEPTLPKTVSKGKLSDYQVFERTVRARLAGLGLDEVVTYSLVSDERVHDFDKDNCDTVSVAMPMSLDRKTLTLSPLNGIVDVIKHNVARKNSDLFVFEVGKKYQLDNEEPKLAGAITGLYTETNWKGEKEVADFYTLKGILDSLFEQLHLTHLEYEPMSDYKNLHPGQSAYIKDFKGVVGFIGKLHPEYAKSHSLKNVYVFELDMEKLYSLRRPLKKVKDINKFPEIERDIALVVDDIVTANELLQVIKKAGKRMLLSANVFDLYKGEPLEDNQKSLAIKLTFSDPKRTLETKEVDQRVNEILGVLKARLSAVLR
jgi:phenylalanyl-tRNA synthetase beta chain